MNEVLKTVLSMSFSGGIVILLLLLVLLPFRKKLSRQWQYYLWLIAVARLLLPFAPPQNLMYVFFQTGETAVSSTADAWQTVKLSGTDGDLSEEAAGGRSGKGPESWQSIRSYLWVLWLLPAVVLFIRKITAYQFFLQSVRAGSEAVEDIALLERFGELLEENRIRRAIELSVNSWIASPVLIGFFRPCIVLPSLEMTDLEFTHTILHELIHARRMDILYKWLVQVTVCLHWFQPLAYVMQARVSRACELSCDEAVLQKLDAQERQSYGETLLRAAKRQVNAPETVSFLGFHSGKKYLKERLDAVMNFQKTTKTAFFTALALTVLLGAGSAYMGVYAAAKNTSKSEILAASPAQAPHSVVCKNGEYFILFGKADEKDIPDSTGPDYGVTFGAVWPDAYVSFDSYHVNQSLTKKIEKECKHMRKKKWLTKKEANAIVAVAAQVQQGDTGNFQTDEQEEAYSQWDIQSENGAYYYQNKRVRILMDTRKDHSFANFFYDKKGSVDLKIVRDENNAITKVRYLSKKTAKEILSEIE